MSVLFDNSSNAAQDASRTKPEKAFSSFTHFLNLRAGAPDVDEGGDRSFERIESVVHLTLAFTVVAGAALILSIALFSPGAPLGGATGEARIPVAAAPPLAAAPVEPKPALPTEEASAAPAEPDRAAPPAAADPVLDARPMTETAAAMSVPSLGPEPLAPPSPAMREKLEAREAPPPLPQDASAYEAPTAAAEPKAVASANEEAAPPESAKDDVGTRMSKCFVRLSGRVQTSGPCRVSRTGESVTFQLPGKSLTLAHGHGRVWTATLGGRNLGKVYKSGACWGAKGVYVCDKG